MPDVSFKNLGPYRIEGILGRGGMGSVYAARNRLTGERAAVKALAPGLCDDPEFRERFIAEIESLKKLHHPHIVQLYGFGEHDGHLYYAMELVEGTSLEQELAAGRRFTWREVTQIGIDVALALKHAHDHGVIHRDLKPGNLLLDEDDRVKLTDFGIAKLFGASRVTAGGHVLGTADYMAPEQAAGKPTTPRCDLYSLGCVMYALLAGRPPFSGKTLAEVVHNVRYQTADPVTRYNSEVPVELVEIIDELLVKDPDQRIRTALSLSHRLRAVQQSLTIERAVGEDLGKGPVGSPSRNATGAGPSVSILNPPTDIAQRPTVTLADPTEDRLPRKEEQSDETDDETPSIKRDHFTPVDKTSPPKSDTKSDISSALLLVIFLLLTLGGIMGGLWYASRPLSVDALYQKIHQVIDQAEPSSVLDAEADVERFLRNFPDDVRIDEIKQYAEEIELYRLNRSLELRRRGRRTTGTLSPIEKAYLDARKKSDDDLDAAIGMLQAVVKLYGGEENPPIKTRRVVELARKQLKKWQEQVDAVSIEHTEMLRDKLAYAEEIKQEKPLTAVGIWEGIVELYQRKPWACEQVEQARRELRELKSRPTNPSPEKAR